MEIKIGTVVQLKSGGPKMTVDSVHDTGKLKCTWFIDGKVTWQLFAIETLKVADEDVEAAGITETITMTR